MLSVVQEPQRLITMKQTAGETIVGVPTNQLNVFTVIMLIVRIIVFRPINKGIQLMKNANKSYVLKAICETSYVCGS